MAEVLTTLDWLAEESGAEVLVYFKPPMNCWHHIGFRATPGQRKAVDEALRTRGLEFRDKRGGFPISCPEEARR